VKHIDISHNHIGEKGCEGFGDCIRSNNKIEFISLQNNKLYDVSGQKLLHAVSENTKLKTLKLGLNCINYKYIDEIQSHLKKNRSREKKRRVPSILGELEELHKEVETGEQIINETHNCTFQKSQIKKDLQKVCNSKSISTLHFTLDKLHEIEVILFNM
jgi:hypothetical protein